MIFVFEETYKSTLDSFMKDTPDAPSTDLKEFANWSFRDSVQFDNFRVLTIRTITALMHLCYTCKKWLFGKSTHLLIFSFQLLMLMTIFLQYTILYTYCQY